MQHLIVILDDSAPSFCYYPSSKRPPRLIDLEVLKAVIEFAQKRNMLINFLVGEMPLPEEYLEVLDKICHLFIRPHSIPFSQLEDVVSIYIDDVKNLPSEKLPANVILRIHKSCLPHLAIVISYYMNICSRVNVYLLDVDCYSSVDIEMYNMQLEDIMYAYKEASKQEYKELNLLTDRLMLNEMKNCDAGVEHVTIAPNGKFYVCPAFYFEDPTDSIGDLNGGLEIRNGQLYRLEYAPICKRCDAFQCKRCVWLNRKTTREVNTPSHEQCVLSHLERNISREFSLSMSGNDSNIPELDYLDPFETYW